MIFTRDQLASVVANIRTPHPTITGSETVGTAIFIAKSNTEAYLVTAHHVAKEINVNSKIVFSQPDGTPKELPLAVFTGGADFIIHPTADLAKAAVQANPLTTPHLAGRFFPYSQVDLSDNLISKDVELTTIGFPNGLGANGPKFTPLTYRTYVSGQIITLNRADIGLANDFIILERPSIGGYSGGPVFNLGYMIVGNMTSSSGSTILHGIVHGTLSDKTGGKLAAITPTKYLKDWL